MDNRAQISNAVGGRTLFSNNHTYELLEERFGYGDDIKAIRVLDSANFYDSCVKAMLPLIVVKRGSELHFWTASGPPTVETGDAVIGLIEDEGTR